MISLCVPVYRDSESRGRRGEDGMWKMKESLYFPIFGYLISLTGIFLLSLFTPSPPPPLPLVSLFHHVIFDSLIHCVACLRFPWKQKGEDKMDFWNASREDSASLLLNIYTKWEELEVSCAESLYIYVFFLSANYTQSIMQINLHVFCGR